MRALSSFRWLPILTLVVLAASLATGRPQDHAATTGQLPATTETSRSKGENSKIEIKDDKSNATAIGESIKMVASQLLHASKDTPPGSAGSGAIVEDVRTPPKVKNQANKNKVKVGSTTSKPIPMENSHAGIALPLNVDEVNKELFKIDKNASNKESSTSNEGLSTWILLSGSSTTTVRPTRYQTTKTPEQPKIDKPKNDQKKDTPRTTAKPKSKATPKPIRQTTPAPKPIFQRKPVAIGSTNKSDLIAGGSAVNENVMNKIKATVLASVQKNKNAALSKNTTQTTAPTTTPKPKTTQVLVKFVPETTTKSPKVNEAPKKDKNKNTKVTTTTTVAPKIDDLASNIIESKHAEIELEVSTPANTRKEPKRNSNKRKKNKNRRRKPASSTTAKPDLEEAESKITDNNTKVANKVKDKPITTQIYNYLSREVMPSVGVGLVSLAGLVGLASYFLYPFSGVVRRAYDADDRKDDFYSKNGELYAPGEGGHSEVEMLDEVYGGMSQNIPKKERNPYSGQPQFRYPQNPANEQNLRYRNVAYNNDMNSFIPSNRVGQQSPEGIQGASYSEQIHYDTHISSPQDAYQAYQPQPVYKSQENLVVEPTYPEEPTHAGYVVNERLNEPVYGHAMRYSQEIINAEPTKSPDIETLHLGAEDVIEKQKETGYTVASVGMDSKEPQFVVGNIPKELMQPSNPAVVPEHGPRSLRIRRAAVPSKSRSLVTNLEEVLREAKQNVTDLELSNEIDEALGLKKESGVSVVEAVSIPTKNKDASSVTIQEIGDYLTTKKYPNGMQIMNMVTQETTQSSPKSTKQEIDKMEMKQMINDVNKAMENEIQFEVVTTGSDSKTSPKDPHVFVDYTTKTPMDIGQSMSPANQEMPSYGSAEIPHMPDVDEGFDMDTNNNAGGGAFSFLGFLRSLLEFKLRLGVSILQSTSESLARYLRGMQQSLGTVASASQQAQEQYQQYRGRPYH